MDDPQRVEKCVNGRLISRFDRTAVLESLREAWCVVCCTGKADALADTDYINILMHGQQLMVNMGVEDEWGEQIPLERVFNNKQPLNFILPEPTLLRYIDPTMALSNEAALALLSGKIPPGVNRIAPETEKFYMDIVENEGLITEDLKGAGLI